MSNRPQQYIILGYRMSQEEFYNLNSAKQFLINAREHPDFIDEDSALCDFRSKFEVSYSNDEGHKGIQLACFNSPSSGDVAVGKCLMKSQYAHFIEESLSLNFGEMDKQAAHIRELFYAVFDTPTWLECGIHFVTDFH